MTTARDEIIQRLWRGVDPFQGLPAALFAADTQGWNSSHAYLAEAMVRRRPAVTVELGVWKGASTLTLAAAIKKARIDGVVIAVDTWLGSWDHWADASFTAELCTTFGYPNLYYKFMANVVRAGLQDYVVPLPLDSANAAYLLGSLGIVADVIHIDGAHDYKSTADDLARWWDVLALGGELIADDYDAKGKVWPEVARAVNDFRKVVANSDFQASHLKCRMVKC